MCRGEAQSQSGTSEDIAVAQQSASADVTGFAGAAAELESVRPQVTTSVTRDELVASLKAAVANPTSVGSHVAEFLNRLRSADKLVDASPSQEKTLRDLAYDLEYFVANRIRREEDPAYFGPGRVLAEIQNALAAPREGNEVSLALWYFRWRAMC